MIRDVLICLALGTMAWGQAAPSPAPGPPNLAAPSLAAPSPASNPDDNRGLASNLPQNAPVITISGLCSNPPADKATAANCKTVITRLEFERMVNAVQPAMSPDARRQFASRYANALVLAQKAHEMRLDQGPEFEEHMKLARFQVLTEELHQALQEKASSISDKDVEDYYHSNIAAYEEADVRRLFIPNIQQLPTPSEKLSDAQEEKRTQESKDIMKAEADKLRARALAGEDFDKLQEESFKLARITMKSPKASIGKVRRDNLPPGQVSIMDLKPGEVSPVLPDQSGYLIYKIGAKETLPLDKVGEDIRGKLRTQRLQDEIEAIQGSAVPTFEKGYFGKEDVR